MNFHYRNFVVILPDLRGMHVSPHRVGQFHEPTEYQSGGESNQKWPNSVARQELWLSQADWLQFRGKLADVTKQLAL